MPSSVPRPRGHGRKVRITPMPKFDAGEDTVGSPSKVEIVRQVECAALTRG